MTFARVNPGGWAFGEVLTSGQMNPLDIDHVAALDGSVATGGGTYSPAARLNWRNTWTFDGDSLPVSGLEIMVNVIGSTAFNSASVCPPSPSVQSRKIGSDFLSATRSLTTSLTKTGV